MNRHDKRTLPTLAIVLLGTLLSLPATLVAEEKPLKLYGSGATLPAPLYASWMYSFNDAHPEIESDYQGIGSAGGLKDLAEERVDFAGADFMLAGEEASEMAGGIIQLPMAAAGIALIYNVADVPELKLSRQAMIGIFGGTIARWNDSEIAKTNPKVRLPDAPVVVIARGAASGTSYNLTNHLSRISPELAESIGVTLTPPWPMDLKQQGRLVRATGNDGVAAMVKAIPGSIGYVSYPYSYMTDIPMAAIENNAGKLVAPNDTGFEAAVRAIAQDASLSNLADPPGEDAYPIVAVSWLMLRKTYDDPAKQQALVELIEYALGPGQETAKRIGYIPFSPEAVALVKRDLDALK